jgi:hypothetical protein
VRLQPIGADHKHVPYIVASAPANLISGHNDIYNPNFILFLIGYIDSSLPGPARAHRPARRSRSAGDPGELGGRWRGACLRHTRRGFDGDSINRTSRWSRRPTAAP